MPRSVHSTSSPPPSIDTRQHNLLQYSHNSPQHKFTIDFKDKAQNNRMVALNDEGRIMDMDVDDDRGRSAESDYNDQERDELNPEIENGGSDALDSPQPQDDILPTSHATTGERQVKLEAEYDAKMKVPFGNAAPGGRSTSAPIFASQEFSNPDPSTRSGKRRKAKRSEDERIEYFRSDPFIAKFEAYKVLCASCDRWIKLRPNSTFCSIPWDAHRRSCLSRKTSKKEWTLENRDQVFMRDQNVKKFDAERLLCNTCDKWISLDPVDHHAAVQMWITHKAKCGVTSAVVVDEQSGSVSPSLPPMSSPSVSTSPPTFAPRPLTASPFLTLTPLSQLISTQEHGSSSHASSSTVRDLNTTNFAPSNESRQRNAEHRAAKLKADTLIEVVEPNRVFCSLCKKWVQLRQDSSYCAYPWLQHRGKCLARTQRIAQKATEVTPAKTKKHEEPQLHARKYPPSQHVSSHYLAGPVVQYHPRHSAQNIHGREQYPHLPPIGYHDRYHSHEQDQHRLRREVLSDTDGGPNEITTERGRRDLRNEDGAVHARETESNRQGQTYERYHSYPRHQSERDRYYQVHPRRSGLEAAYHPYYHSTSRSYSHHTGQDEGYRSRKHKPGKDHSHKYPDPPTHLNRLSPPHHRTPAPIIDLDTTPGRRNFIYNSVVHLLSTTYETTDDLRVDTLVGYLNAAVPVDKYEDFGTEEVVRALGVLSGSRERDPENGGRLVLEGDLVSLG